MTQLRRVVITGTGIVSPVGNDRETAWRNICEGRSGIRRIEAFDTSNLEVHIAGEVRDFDPLQCGSKREVRRMDPFVRYAIAAADQAVKQSRLVEDGFDPERAGVYIGTGIGGLQEIESQHLMLIHSGPQRVSPLMIPKLMTNAAAGHVSIRYGFAGPSMSVSSACASGSNAIGEAFDSIRYGLVDVQVCGGSEAAITPMGVTGFAQLNALSTRNDEPEKACRPFEKNRDGFVMAEGAGILVLEALDRAKARGATILAEIIGYGSSSDAFHMTLPDQQGKGALRAMCNAIRDAGIKPEDVDYINAHGTGTPAGDDIEARAIMQMFAEHAKNLAVSSTKSIFGHLLGASGAVESLVCIWAILDDICPPTINLDEVDPACAGLNYVPHVSQKRRVNVVMNNSFGFGGHNVGLIFRKYLQ